MCIDYFERLILSPKESTKVKEQPHAHTLHIPPYIQPLFVGRGPLQDKSEVCFSSNRLILHIHRDKYKLRSVCAVCILNKLIVLQVSL